QLIPAGGALHVLGDAKPLGVKFGNQRLGGRIALFGARQGQLQCREEISALEGAKGIVDIFRRAEHGIADGLGIVGLRPDRLQCAEAGQGNEAGAPDHERSRVASTSAARALAGSAADQTLSESAMNSAPVAVSWSGWACGSEWTAGISKVSAHHWANSAACGSEAPPNGPKNR